MKTHWENDGKANEQGEFIGVVDLEDGSGPQRFIGASELEVANKLLVAQGNATKKIREQERIIKGNRTPDLATAQPNFQRKPMDADTRFTVAQEITDPAKSPEAIRTVLESELGAPIESIRARLAQDEIQRQQNEAVAEAQAFEAETPDYGHNPHNANLLGNYCMKMGWAPTRNSFARAWEDLKAAGLVILKTEATETVEEVPAQQPVTPQQQSGLPVQPAVTTRPRGTVSSTGVRNGDSSGIPGARTVAPKYTIEQINSMGIDEYQNKLRNEAGFAAVVDALYAPKKA